MGQGVRLKRYNKKVQSFALDSFVMLSMVKGTHIPSVCAQTDVW